MKLLDSLSLAVQALFANKMRSGLTMLGVIIGVAAVITLMSVGRGAQQQITSTIEEMGSNTLTVISQTPGAAGLAAMQSATSSLTMDDAEAILQRVPGVLRVAPVNENFVEVVYGNENVMSVIEGTTPDFGLIYNYPAEFGSYFTEREVATRSAVVVLGAKTAQDLFGDEDPLGKDVKISGRRFSVVGIIEEKGGSMMGVSMDSVVIVPITTYQSRLFPRQTQRGEDAVQSIAVQIADLDQAPLITEDIADLLRRRHHIGADDKDDFTIVSQEQIVGIFTEITGVFTIILGAIASISLLVGGIGIMNIMLVSVTERTREIGVRKAVGAKQRDILGQFLFEAAILSLTGGIIGIISGWLLSAGISLIDLSGTRLNTVVSADIVLLAASVAIIIGLISGMYPAVRASRLNPIDALRYG